MTTFSQYIIKHESALFSSVWSYRIVRVVLSAVFLRSGTTKLLDPEAFAVLIGAYGLIPEAWNMPMAVALPAFEIFAGIGLLLDVRGSLTMIAGLLVLFLLILSYGTWMGLDVDCGCFGPGDPEVRSFHGLQTALYRDLMMVGSVFYLYIWRYTTSARPTGLSNIAKMFFVRRSSS